ncbi:hypothetical protein [Streptomyces sp. IBSBF 3136]|uniref:hypothetical protein n=1 Tax=Streptomyces sp. IBSBF 3136 TaxID=2903524 RepID=UPI002FDC6495
MACTTAAASATVAEDGLCPSLGLPLLGRLADRRGLPLPCHLGAVLVAAALSALALAGTASLPFTALCVAVAGAGCPPLEGSLRSLYPAVLPDAAHVRTAYTLDSFTQQIVYVAGPALAVATATLRRPRRRPSPWRPQPLGPAPSSSPPRAPPEPGAPWPAARTR